MMNCITYIESPVGLIEISGDEECVKSVLFVEEKKHVDSEVLYDVVMECRRQLMEYFGGDRKEFELALGQDGTEFQRRVWDKLMTVGYGKTASYMRLAKALGDPKCIRAAGTANGKNKLAIIVPCHRIIGADGALVGYAGGLHRKRWLLDHEAKMSGALRLGV